jgi:hypothetical protein
METEVHNRVHKNPVSILTEINTAHTTLSQFYKTICNIFHFLFSVSFLAETLNRGLHCS